MSAAQKTWLGHPRGLTVLFGTEMWERMSYYGMRTLLVVYMVKYLLLPGHVEHVLFFPQIRAFYEFLAGPLAVQPLSSLIYGTYTGLVYASPMLGGFIADRFTGQRRIVILGVVLMAFGHFMMAFESLLFPALLLLIVGVGFFKTNTTTQVGMLYAEGDRRRANAYSIFYVGINIGSTLGPLVCGTLGEEVGWHYGFTAAGVGILLALAVYLSGWGYLPAEGARRKSDGPRKPLTPAEWKSVAALVILTIPLTLYWACNEQQANAVALWSIDKTDRMVNLFGAHFQIPWTWFQSLDPIIIVFGTPFVLALWDRQAARAPNDVIKMAWGCLLMTIANLVMAFAAWQAGPHLASWLWLMPYFFILTIGEIYLSPISLSLYSKVAPLSIASFMMAVNFIPNFLGGGFLQGYLGTFWERMDKASFFVMIAVISAIAGGIIWAFDRPLRPYLEDRA